jgi:FkbM family methyltransferase
MLPGEFKRCLGVHLGIPDARWSLMQLRHFGFIPSHVLDVGAYRGDWTKICLDVFPGANITCIEPQDECQENLRELATRNSNIQIIQMLLGRSVRDIVPFNEMGSGSSVLSNCQRGHTREMTSIDALIEWGYCQPPELLKLDVQGYELEILEGYKRHFDACQVIQSEISLVPIIEGAPLLHDVVNYLHERRFVMFDVDELIRAPSDGAVWQIDALFCRMDSRLRKDRVWKSGIPMWGKNLDNE